MRYVNLVFVNCLFLVSGLFAAVPDSVGYQAMKDRSYVIYEVDSGETLFSISNKYNCRIIDIMTENNLQDEFNLARGQLLFLPVFKQIETTDPVKVQSKSGSKSRLHVVEAGESLYSIARTYKVDFKDLAELNPSLENYVVKPGQNILIPESPKISSVATRIPDNALIHKVSSGETVYSISRQYGGLDMNRLREWNSIPGDTIRDGQALIIGWMIKQAFIENDRQGVVLSPCPPDPPSINDQTTETNPTDALSAITRDSETIADAPEKEEVSSVISASEFQERFNLYTENSLKPHKGIATWMKDDLGYGAKVSRFYALHDLAPVGSIIRITNMMNNRIIYAKVIGDLPNNKADEKSIVKLSFAAAKELKVIDDRFLVKVEYIGSANTQ